jgi:paraquat-inducible protein B
VKQTPVQEENGHLVIVNKLNKIDLQMIIDFERRMLMSREIENTQTKTKSIDIDIQVEIKKDYAEIANLSLNFIGEKIRSDRRESKRLK